ncbi:molybdenum cofactor guanylyltransferase [Ornithinibacillus contaminans]|uniref:molybdenum cofactor guanylyltransferase n=1 Tax=Ornithinibacillus contaminans TaxID=694055 RepID=UPI00064D9DCF|nr:molybdenum cofactor guanylyltransferase [Ornithinibacillus contaminans]
MKESIAGIILAGGQSRRFGSPKAFVEKDGTPFFHYSIHAMSGSVDSIIIVARSELISRFKGVDLNIELISDLPEIAGMGPLAGIYSGMDKEVADWYLIAPIDVPFIESWVFEKLIQYTNQDTDAIVPMVNGKMQPLISVFRNSIKEKIKRQLEVKELSMKQLFEKCQVTYVEIDSDRPFININQIEDYKRYIN